MFRIKSFLAFSVICFGAIGVEAASPHHRRPLSSLDHECCVELESRELSSVYEWEGIEQYTYLRFGASRFSLRSGDTVGPSIHVGRRYEMQDASVDLSINWGQSESLGGKKTNYFLSAPRVGYLIYTHPALVGSVIFGPAVSWVFLKEGVSGNYFTGVAIEGSLGYEFHRCGGFRVLAQLDVSQPILAAKRSGDRSPRPVFTFSFGTGF